MWGILLFGLCSAARHGPVPACLPGPSPFLLALGTSAFCKVCTATRGGTRPSGWLPPILGLFSVWFLVLCSLPGSTPGSDQTPGTSKRPALPQDRAGGCREAARLRLTGVVVISPGSSCSEQALAADGAGRGCSANPRSTAEPSKALPRGWPSGALARGTAVRSVLAFLPLPAPFTARNKNLPGLETPSPRATYHRARPSWWPCWHRP